MKKFIACLLFCLASLTGFSQKVYFVYLQSEAEQPFFVKMSGKIHSSSASGYLILSKLRDSTYNFTVGFPQNKWPDQNFTVVINRKDHGYILKNFAEKGWGIFDLHTLSVQMSAPGSAKMEEKKNEESKDVSVFTEILSKAAGDPSLKEKPSKPEIAEKKPETVNQENETKGNTVELIKDTSAIKTIEIIEQSQVKKEEPAISNPEQPVEKAEEIVALVSEPYKPTVVTKKSESSTTEGFGLVFIDHISNDVKDTIRLLIPNPKSVVNIIKEEPAIEKKVLEILPDTIKKKEEKPVDVMTVVTENKVEKNTQKNNCPSVAEESDFFILRKNMAAAEGDDNMLTEAKNYFKTKCFTTDQVRNLGLLFLNDEGKYKFYDLAYAFVTDMEKFSGLQNELKDEYYINRFKAMLRN